MRAALRLMIAVFLVAARPVAPAPASPARLCVVFVVDGLRPDSINPDDTPTIARLRAAGVEYVNSHSVFPTVTRVNTAALVSGAYPDAAGIVGNSMFVAGVNARAPFNTSDHRALLKLEEATGRAITSETLGEVLQAHGRRLVTLSSGSTGNAFLLNPQARHGAGVAISGNFERGVTAAYPQANSDAILQRFGPPPVSENDGGVARMEWTDTVLRDYVLGELRPDVVIDWEEGVDSTQHTYGVGSPQAKDGLKHIDASIGRTLAKIEALGLRDRTDVFVISDHGFTRHARTVNVAQALVDAGLKAARDSTDVIIASDSEALLFYVHDHAPARIAEVARFLQQQPWADVIFTAPGEGTSGKVAGTLSLDLIHAAHPTRAADIIVSMAWNDEANAFGVRGSHTVNAGGGANGHGGLNPWTVRNTFIASGPSFKRQMTIAAPAATPDVAPTILAMLGITDAKGIGVGPSGGRVLRELLKDGPADTVKAVIRTIIVNAGAYRASVQISSFAGHDYVDEGRREP
jgi:predicted AlkP superfamily pyrophosphatase or phosphodiesterase